jgi:AcrR family transcriptional regulator
LQEQKKEWANRRTRTDGALMSQAQSQHGRAADFRNFQADFPLQGRAIYQTLFERNKDRITTNKAKFAVVNLEKIFTATFELTPRIGFPMMSLRDLSRATGLSMGGIYSYIESKERIAIMVKDLVKLVIDELLARAMSLSSAPMNALETAIREHIFAAEMLQEWFNFLYFETRSLPHEHQEDSKNIELQIESAMHELIDQVRLARNIACGNSPIIATTLIALIQDRYLKPWKHSKSGESADDYAQQVLALMHCAIEHP